MQVPMTVIAADGYVHFGDILQLGSCKTGAALALDTEDSDPRPGEYACALSASLDTTPMARNTFILVKYHLPKGAIPGGAYGPVYDDEVSLTVNRSTPIVWMHYNHGDREPLLPGQPPPLGRPSLCKTVRGGGVSESVRHSHSRGRGESHPGIPHDVPNFTRALAL